MKRTIRAVLLMIGTGLIITACGGGGGGSSSGGAGAVQTTVPQTLTDNLAGTWSVHDSLANNSCSWFPAPQSLSDSYVISQNGNNLDATSGDLTFSGNSTDTGLSLVQTNPTSQTTSGCSFTIGFSDNATMTSNDTANGTSTLNVTLSESCGSLSSCSVTYNSDWTRTQNTTQSAKTKTASKDKQGIVMDIQKQIEEQVGR